MDVLIRQMRLTDIAAGMELKTFANWNQTEDDWRVFLEANPKGCLVAECNGKVVGSTTVILYGPSFAWIGMVLVHPEYRSRGIATRLMKTALDLLADCPTVGLDATAAGKLVYDKLGFKEECVIHRMTATQLESFDTPAPSDSETGNAGYEVCPIDEEAMPRIEQMDHDHVEIDRAFLLKSLRVRTPDVALHLKNDGAAEAYCLGRQGTKFFQIGPVLAQHDQHAIRLLHAVLPQFGGEAVVLDIPARHERVRTWLEESGFAIQRDFIRMVRGKNLPGDTMRHQYAICGPEFG